MSVSSARRNCPPPISAMSSNMEASTSLPKPMVKITICAASVFWNCSCRSRRLYSLAFSRDGKLLATGGVGELRLAEVLDVAQARRRLPVVPDELHDEDVVLQLDDARARYAGAIQSIEIQSLLVRPQFDDLRIYLSDAKHAAPCASCGIGSRR